MTRLIVLVFVATVTVSDGRSVKDTWFKLSEGRSDHDHDNEEAFDWGYTRENGPAVWPKYYPQCGGSSQSPIDLPDISPSSALPRKAFKLTFSWLKTERNLDILNNGHTVQVNIPRGVKVGGGGLPATYEVAQFHFHWGSNPSTGSEHTLGGQHAPMELHIVTWNPALGDFSTAVSQPQGVAVLGFFVEIDKFNPYFEPLVKALNGVEEPEDESEVTMVNLYDLVMPSMRSAYFRYDGSLTTPTCNEGIVWTIFRNPIAISLQQWERFTKLDGRHGRLVNNFRPTQPLNDRQVQLFSAV